MSSRSASSSTPAPLRTSHIPNTQYPFLANSPGAYLTPKDGAFKLRVKSGITSEIKSNVDSRFNGLRPVTPRPSKATMKLINPQEIRMDGPPLRGLTPSDSLGSLDEYEYGGITTSRGSLDLVRASEEDLGESETVLVTVRIRPPGPSSLREQENGNVWETYYKNTQQIKIAKASLGTKDDREWNFDRILSPESDNLNAYSTSAKTHVKRAMEGFNTLIFAYGQTASGKTHTLSGSPSEPGIIPLAMSDLFYLIQSSTDREFLLRASYLELYNETLLDLLSGDGRELSLSEKKKGEVVVNGLTECAVRTEKEVGKLLKVGEDNRKVGKTDWNARSSRSHCVFRLVIESRAAKSCDGTRTPGGRLMSNSDKTTRISTLSIIDLAGSEKHTSSKERNAEGKHINQSLLTLKIVISKLADLASGRNVSHVPYRDSKLTRLLQPSLSGNALISVICTISPSHVNLNESLSTLSFAQGLKRVLLRAKKREEVDPQALIQQYQEEIAELRALLKEKESGRISSISAVKGGKGRGDMEKRLVELKSLILTGGAHSSSHENVKEARPVSPTKLKFPKLNFDKSTAELREDLHAADLRISDQEDEIYRLKQELQSRTSRPDKTIQELQQEVAGLKMIADDYERHLREPSRKVREDVEREWKAKVEKLEKQLESKHIWACRLDENVRAVTEENTILKSRCEDAEQKVHLIIDWLNSTLSEETPAEELPELVVSAPPPPSSSDDFSPNLNDNTDGKLNTFTLSARMTRDKLSHMDISSLSQKFDSLGARGRGVKMLREESCFDLDS